MRRIYALALLLSLMTGTATATSFESTEPKAWQASASMTATVPVPVGWTLTSDSARLFGARGSVLRGVPPGAESKSWMATGFELRHFTTPPKSASHDALHLAYIKALARDVRSHRLLAWQVVGDVRASLHAIEGPGGEAEIDIVLSRIQPDGSALLMTAFAPKDGFEAMGTAAYAGQVFETLTERKGLAADVARIVPRDQPEALKPPYTSPDATRSIDWAGRSLTVPDSWQIALEPMGQGIAHGESMTLRATPNFDDPTAPVLAYSVEPAGARFTAPQPAVAQHIVQAKASQPDYKLQRASAFGKWACARESYSTAAGGPREEAYCLLSRERDGLVLIESYSLSAPEGTLDRYGAERAVLLMNGEIPPDRLDAEGTLALDPVEPLATTRAIAPFPALVPFGAGYRAPAGWETTLSYRDGALRFTEATGEPIEPTLSIQTRIETGGDAEVAISSLIETSGIEGFTLTASDYLTASKGVIVVGDGTKNGVAIRIAALAEQDYPAILTFSAPPEAFDEMGGAALLAPVFLGFAPDAFDDLKTPEERIARIADRFGKTLAERRKREADVAEWALRTETESVLQAYRTLSLSLTCGGWCY